MSAHIFDIDGTVVNYHTNDWIVGAKEYIINLYKEDNDIIFITMRDKNEIWSVKNTENIILKELDNLNVKYKILYNVQSPRIIHDDSNVYVDSRQTNQKYWQ